MTKLTLLNQFGANLYPASLIEASGATLALARVDGGKRLIVVAPIGHAWLDRFSGEAQEFDREHTLKAVPARCRQRTSFARRCAQPQPCAVGIGYVGRLRRSDGAGDAGSCARV